LSSTLAGALKRTNRPGLMAIFLLYAILAAVKMKANVVDTLRVIYLKPKPYSREILNREPKP